MDTGLGKSSFVAVIGAANMDLMGKMVGPAVEGDSNPGELTVSAGGVARNIAENLAHLGTPCELITALGNDAWGQQLRQHCDSLGIGLSRSIVSDEHRTSTYLSTHDNQGELITAINDMAILDCLSAKNLESRIELLKAAFIFPNDFYKNAENIDINTLGSHTLYQLHQQAWKNQQGMN